MYSYLGWDDERATRNEYFRRQWRNSEHQVVRVLNKNAVAKIRAEFDLKPQGLSLREFVDVMTRCLGHMIIDKIGFVATLIDLFRDVDVNGDGAMEWEEFTGYLVQLGTYDADGSEFFRTKAKYKFLADTDPQWLTRTSPVARVVVANHSITDRRNTPPTGRSKTQWPIVLTIEEDSQMLRLYRTVEQSSTIALFQQQFFRHDTAFYPHSVLAAAAIPELDIMATTSQESRAGPFYLSFFDINSNRLLSRVSTQTAQDVLCWCSAVSLLYCSGTDGRDIRGYDPTSFSVRQRLAQPAGSTRTMVAVPDHLAALLLTGSSDGCLRVYDARGGTLLEDRMLDAHQLGVQHIKISRKLDILVSAGLPFLRGKRCPVFHNTVLVWPLSKWIGDLANSLASIHVQSADVNTRSAVIPKLKSTAQIKPIVLSGHSFSILGIDIQDHAGVSAHIISADDGGFVRIWNHVTGACTQILNVMQREIRRTPSIHIANNSNSTLTAKESPEADETFVATTSDDSNSQVNLTLSMLHARKSSYGRSAVRLHPDRGEGLAEDLWKTAALQRKRQPAIDLLQHRNTEHLITPQIHPFAINSEKDLSVKRLGLASQQNINHMAVSDYSRALKRAEDHYERKLRREVRRISRSQSETMRSSSATSIFGRRQSIGEDDAVESSGNPILVHDNVTEGELSDGNTSSDEDNEADGDTKPVARTENLYKLKTLNSIAVLPPECGGKERKRMLLLCGERLRLLYLSLSAPEAGPAVAAFYMRPSITFCVVYPKAVIVWDALCARPVRVFSPVKLLGHDREEFTCGCPGPRERLLYIGTSMGTIIAINYSAGSRTKRWRPFRKSISVVSLVYVAPVEELVALGSNGLACVLDDSNETLGADLSGSLAVSRGFGCTDPRDLAEFLNQHPRDVSDDMKFNEENQNSSASSSMPTSVLALLRRWVFGQVERLPSGARNPHVGRLSVVNNSSWNGSTLHNADNLSDVHTEVLPKMSSNEHKASSLTRHTSHHSRSCSQADAVTADNGENCTNNGRATDNIDAPAIAVSHTLGLLAMSIKLSHTTGKYGIIIWDYTSTQAVGICVPPEGFAAMHEPLTLKFLNPYPLLVSGDSVGRIHLWAVPPSSATCTLRGYWVTLTGAPILALDIIRDHADDRVAYPTNADVDGPIPPVQHGTIGLPLLNQVTELRGGYTFLTGDDAGEVHRWRLPLSAVAVALSPDISRICAMRNATASVRTMKTNDDEWNSSNFTLQDLWSRPVQLLQACMHELFVQNRMKFDDSENLSIPNIRESRTVTKLMPATLLGLVNRAMSQHQRYSKFPFVAETISAVREAHFGVIWETAWKAHDGPIRCIGYVDENHSIITSAHDSLTRLWDVEGRHLGALDPNPRYVAPLPPWEVDSEGQENSSDLLTAAGHPAGATSLAIRHIELQLEGLPRAQGLGTEPEALFAGTDDTTSTNPTTQQSNTNSQVAMTRTCDGVGTGVVSTDDYTSLRHVAVRRTLLKEQVRESRRQVRAIQTLAGIESKQISQSGYQSGFFVTSLPEMSTREESTSVHLESSADSSNAKRADSRSNTLIEKASFGLTKYLDRLAPSSLGARGSIFEKLFDKNKSKSRNKKARSLLSRLALASARSKGLPEGIASTFTTVARDEYLPGVTFSGNSPPQGSVYWHWRANLLKRREDSRREALQLIAVSRFLRRMNARQGASEVLTPSAAHLGENFDIDDSSNSSVLPERIDTLDKAIKIAHAHYIQRPPSQSVSRVEENVVEATQQVKDAWMHFMSSVGSNVNNVPHSADDRSFRLFDYVPQLSTVGRTVQSINVPDFGSRVINEGLFPSIRSSLSSSMRNRGHENQAGIAGQYKNMVTEAERTHRSVKQLVGGSYKKKPAKSVVAEIFKNTSSSSNFDSAEIPDFVT